MLSAGHPTEVPCLTAIHLRSAVPDMSVPWHSQSADEACRGLETNAQGLTSLEAERRLAQYGPNRLRVPPAASPLRILTAQFRSVVVGLLGAAMLVSWVTGDTADAIAIAAVLVLNAGLGFATELRARRAMEALHSLESPSATVVRDGSTREIAARDVVPGDIIALEAGQSVPADARIIDAAELRTVESSLTGESMPVDKRADIVLDRATLLADRVNLVYQGTSVVAGAAHAIVVATGDATEVGRIGLLTTVLGEEPTPLERKLETLGRRLVWVAVAVAATVAVINLARGASGVEVFTLGVALAVAAVPEGLPAVTTVALAVGVARLARQRALVRRLPAVETLGAVTVICTDKTGTLTRGEMTVTTIIVGDTEIRATGAGYAPTGTLVLGSDTLPADALPALGDALRIGVLVNRASTVETDGVWRAVGDPTEAALLVAARKGGFDTDSIREASPEIGQVPFSSERKWMSTFHRDGTKVLACVKGAPGEILARSSRVVDERGIERSLDASSRRQLEDWNARLADRGLRVLALATALVRQPTEDAITDLTFVAIVGIADPAAEGVRETVAMLRAAGVRTIMLTGDQRLTAAAAARDLELTCGELRIIDGRELAMISDAALPETLRATAALCRVSPSDKLRIVAALQASGEVVAMLGDGVNDAAALRKSDIGVAMGLRGTDVAKDAADMVLADDRFATIGLAVEQGRVVFDNIRKFVFYLFSCNLAEVIVLFAAGSMGVVGMLAPLQILWLNLVTDTFPALALAIEPADRDVMRRPPRDPGKAILSVAFVRGVVFYAAIIAVVTLSAFFVIGDGDVARGRTAAFMTLAFAQAFHLGNGRSREPVVTPRRALANRWALAALVAVVALQVLTIVLPPLRAVLGMVTLGLRDWLLVLTGATLPAVIGQLVRLRHRPQLGDSQRQEG